MNRRLYGNAINLTLLGRRNFFGRRDESASLPGVYLGSVGGRGGSSPNCLGQAWVVVIGSSLPR
jgi:hypothetical protein